MRCWLLCCMRRQVCYWSDVVDCYTHSGRTKQMVFTCVHACVRACDQSVIDILWSRCHALFRMHLLLLSFTCLRFYLRSLLYLLHLVVALATYRHYLTCDMFGRHCVSCYCLLSSSLFCLFRRKAKWSQRKQQSMANSSGVTDSVCTVHTMSIQTTELVFADVYLIPDTYVWVEQFNHFTSREMI